MKIMNIENWKNFLVIDWGRKLFLIGIFKKTNT